MFKKFLIIPLLFLLTNCTTPGSALLGPAFTGVTTKSFAQASISFGTNHIIRQVHTAYKESKKKVKKIAKKIDDLRFEINYDDFTKFHK